MNRLRFVAWIVCMVTVCAWMWGCSDDVSFEWSKTRSDREIAAFVDDSFVVVTDTRRWIESTEGWNGSYSESYGCGNDGICVYNYRVQEDGPRWCDSIDSESGSYHWYQLTDSIVWSGSPWEGAGSFIKLWKIGKKPVKYELDVKKDGCKRSFMPNSYKQWLDGNFIGKNEESFALIGDDCQYAVLDTAKQTLTYKRFDKDFKWIEKCDDVRAWGKDVYCLELDKETYDARFFVNEKLKFTMERNLYKLGNYANVSFMGPYLKLHQTVYKYHENEIERMTSFSLYGISFGDGKGNSITY